MDQPRGDWMQTNSGVQFWPLAPRPEDIRIEDIAHALARQCRFAGHLDDHYSVAQHSVLVSLACEPADALWGLLHDATEAYLVDVPAPVKRSPEMAGYRAIESRLEAVIAERFGLACPMPESVKRADVVLLATEVRDLLAAPPPAPWPLVGIEPLERPITPWSADYAKAVFLARFDELTRVRDQEPSFSAVFTRSTLPAPPDDDEPSAGDWFIGGAP